MGSASQAPNNQRVAMATARASELPVLIISGTDSSRSRIGRGLESIGGMTAETLQRLSTAVGGVVKSPVVLMAKVGGLASPRAATLTAPPGSSLEERVYHLEIQMKSLEEKFNSMTIAMELDLSTSSYKDKPRIMKSLLQEMETDKMLEKHIQMLEDRINERMERFEKALSSIQSRLDHIEFSRHERMVGYKCQESLSSEPWYYDAKQQSNNFEVLEAIEQKKLGTNDVLGEATRGSSTLEKSCVKETFSTSPTTFEHVEPLQEIGVGKKDDFLEPQVISTPVYSKEAFLTQPLKSVAPNSEPAKTVHRDDIGNLPATSDRQLACTLEELHGSFVMESLATASSAKFLEIAQAVTVENSTLAHASSKPQSTFVLKEPREAFSEEPLVVDSITKFEEHVKEDATDKNDTTITTAKLPSSPTFEAIQEDFTKELLAAAPNAKLAQELATQGFVIIALASSEPPMTPKSIEEPLVVVPSVNSKEPTQEDVGDKSATITIVGESPNAFAFQNPQEDFVKESLAGVLGTKLVHEPSSQEDSSTTSDMAFASSPMASKSMEVPSVVTSGANFEELVQENTIGKSDNTIAAVELSSASSREELQEESIKEFIVVESSTKSAQVLAAKDDNDMQDATLESQMASKFLKEPPFAAPSVDFGEPAHDVVDKIGTTIAATNLSLAFLMEESKEGLEKESMASEPSGQSTQEHNDIVVASSELKGTFIFVEEALIATSSANFRECEYKANVDENCAITVGAESPMASSFNNPHKDFEEESLAAAPSVEPAQKLATQEDSTVAPTTSKAIVKSKVVEDQLTVVLGATSEEPTHEDDDKGVTKTAATELSLPSSHEGLQEDFEKESLAIVPSTRPIHKPSSQEDLGATSGKELASSEPQMASKFVQDPSTIVPGATFEEPTHEDDDKGVTKTTATESPLPSSHEGLQEDFEKGSLAIAPGTRPIYKPSSQEDLGATSGKALASSKPQVASKFVQDPSTIVSNVGFKEPMHEDEVEKGVTMTVAREDPQEDFLKESLTTPPNIEPTHNFSSQEDLDATSDMAFASSTLHLASTFVEKPLSATSSAKFEERTQDEDAVNRDTMSASADSPLASLFEESQEDFEKESLEATSSREPAQELTIEEDSHLVPTSFKSQEASKTVEEPLAIIPSADFEEPTYENLADKSVAMTTAGVSPFASSFEGPRKDSKKEAIATAVSIEPTQESVTKEDSNMAPSEPQVTSKFVKEPLTIDMPTDKFEECAHEDIVDKSASVTATIESPLVSSLEEYKKDHMKESLAVGASAKVLEPIEEDESRKNPIAIAPLEAPSTSFLGIPQLKEPLGTSVQLEEPAQEKSGIVLFGAESILTSTIEEGNHTIKEVEHKVAEDFKVHHEHIKSIEKEFPRSQSNLAHVSSDKSLVAEDNDNRLENDQSSEKFFDTEHGSSNFEPWESDEPISFKEFDVGLDEPRRINVEAQKATPIPTSSIEHVQEPEQAPIQELEQDHENAEQAQEHKQQFVQEEEQHAHGQQPAQEHGQQLAQEHGQEIGQEFGQETTKAHGQQPAQESTQVLEQHAQESEQEDLTRNSAMALLPLTPQVTSISRESLVPLVEKPLASVPSTKSEKPPQANAANEIGTHDLPLTSTMEEPKIDIAMSPDKSLSSALFYQSGSYELLENLKHKSSDIAGTSSTPQETLEKESLTIAPNTEIAHGHEARKNGAILASLESQFTPTLEEPQEGFVNEPLVDAELASKSMDLDKSLADEPSTITNTKLVQESVANKISVGLVEESPLISIVEKPQSDNMSSLAKGKDGQDEANQKFLENVKIIAKPIDEAIPRTQSDLTHVKLNLEAIEDNTKLQSQGSFLALETPSVDSKEALVKEPFPSAKLLELFEEENNSRKKDPILADSPMTFTMEEPQKPLVKESLASAKSVPKGHAKRRGFSRSSSEPQFSYKLEDYRKALAKESSVVVVPSASKLDKEHAQEDFGDTQCLPFRILGEGKHPRKELDLKLVEDVKSPVTKSETTSSLYVLEPKPSKIKEKKKKEKKEKKPDATVEEKERRLSLGLGEMERKSSLKAEEKDSKYSPRSEEKHKQPFRHLRDRLRHAFSVNKEP